MARKTASRQTEGDRSVGALNELLTLTFRTDPERAHHIRHALQFLGQEAQTNAGAARTIADLDIIARKLIGLHAGERRNIGFAHCDLSGFHADPLFLRPRILEVVRELVGYGEALLLVSGLRQAVTANARNGSFTAARRNTYLQTQALIEAMVAKFAPPRIRLHLIFI